MPAGPLERIVRDGLPIVMGTVRAEPRLWERYLERGGIAFDTAHHYGAQTERAVGALVQRLGIRSEIVLVGKGAHSPDCYPDVVAPQLDETLAHLRTDYLDLYLLHRDNPDVPITEFAEALHREVAAGRALSVGASNWSSERYRAFNDHATAEGLTPFSALSNQLSLAEMREPVWEGCLRADVGWHEQTSTPLLAWSAQARGFFAGREEDDELRASWLSPANLERRRRCEDLATRLGVAPAAVALAWVLAKPQTFPVVGPRDEPELEVCLASLRIELTGDESRWLALELESIRG